LGCVYTLPENSLYSSINAFLDIENELVNFIEKDMKCALVGDFNAKTGFFGRFFSEPFIDEYREFSGRVYTHPNKRSLLDT
jgi:hypothetical protein